MKDALKCMKAEETANQINYSWGIGGYDNPHIKHTVTQLIQSAMLQPPKSRSFVVGILWFIAGASLSLLAEIYL